MAEDETVRRLNAAGAYLREKSEALLLDVGVQVSPGGTEDFDKLPPWFEGRFNEELDDILARGKTRQPSPPELRRVAELIELLRSEEEALPWWRLAAEAGDRVAIETMDCHESDD